LGPPARSSVNLRRDRRTEEPRSPSAAPAGFTLCLRRLCGSSYAIDPWNRLPADGVPIGRGSSRQHRCRARSSGGGSSPRTKWRAVHARRAPTCVREQARSGALTGSAQGVVETIGPRRHRTNPASLKTRRTGSFGVVGLRAPAPRPRGSATSRALAQRRFSRRVPDTRVTKTLAQSKKVMKDGHRSIASPEQGGLSTVQEE
jgi:hypothetical protein